MKILFFLSFLKKRVLVSRQKRLFNASANNLILHGPIYVSVPNSFHLGHSVVLNEGCYFETVGGFAIGNYVHIARNCTVYTINHNYDSENAIPYDKTVVIKPVIIKDCVWIGANVSIVPGVTIEEGAVVGMGAIITKDVPRGAIVGGNPAKVIGYRDLDKFDQLKLAGNFF